MDNRMLGGMGVGPRKIPGPASKTLVRGVPNASGRIVNMVSRPMLNSSAVAGRLRPGPACSKRSTDNVLRPRADMQPGPSGVNMGFTNRNSDSETILTTCLFCSDRINAEGGNPEMTKQMIRTLCYHMQMDSNELPNEFTKNRFPFCDLCERLLEDVRRNQKIMEEAQANITRAVNAIERIVADDALRQSMKLDKPMTSSTATEQQKFAKLRSMILEVYLNKSDIRKNLRRTMNFRNQPSGSKHPSISNMSVIQDSDNIRRISLSGIKSEYPSTNSENVNTDTDEVENMTIEMHPMDLNTPDEESAEELAPQSNQIQSWNVSESLQEEDLQMEHNDSSIQDTMDDSWRESYQDAHYDENNCTLVISNVRGGNRSQSVKPETIIAPPENENDGYYSNEVSTPLGTGTQKRKLLYDGIEIYKGTCPLRGGDYLQCSRCPHRIPITKYYEKRMESAYVKMKIHIKNSHQKKKKQLPIKKQSVIVPTFSCRTCKKRFPNAKQLRAHEKLHSIPEMECDICGRYVKGWLKNLMTHKFSHKNDEERKAAIAANELGANNTLLSNKVNTPLFKKQIPKPRKYIRKKHKKHAVSKENNVAATVIDLPCTLCPRKFTRRCYLTLHMKTHNSARNAKVKELKKFKSTKKLKRTEVDDESTISESDDAGSEPPETSELTDFVLPPGTNADDIVVEENDTVDSDDGIRGWIDDDEEEEEDEHMD